VLGPLGVILKEVRRMLGNSRIMAAIPVRDVERSRGFYEGLLGLRFAGGPRADGSFEYECGRGTGVFTYPTEQNAGKSPATLAAWQVDDIQATARALRDQDVSLEDYDMPGLKTDDGIASLPGAKALWFRDPDGNILNVFERE
jgi:catechol 2,3-dioxygenase-like lactoylglutathione lyase family enzyme